LIFAREFFAMFDVRHQVPGRLRLHLPCLRTDARLARALPNQLNACDGVLGVRANPVCASLVIAHDPRRISTEALQQQLRTLLPAPSSASRSTKRSATAASMAIQPAAQQRAQGGWLRLPEMSQQREWVIRWKDQLRLGRWRQRHCATTTPAPGVAMLCRMNLRFSRWMLYQTLRCWWNGELAPISLKHARL
jgi:hypothetical protein